MDEMGAENGDSPDFLDLSTDNTKFAQEGEGYEGVGAAHCQVAGDFLQLAQVGLQLGCNVGYRNTRRILTVALDYAAFLAL